MNAGIGKTQMEKKVEGPDQVCHRHQAAWKDIQVGDVAKIPTETLIAIAREIRAAVPYLSGRLPESYLMWKQSSEDYNRILGYLSARDVPMSVLW